MKPLSQWRDAAQFMDVNRNRIAFWTSEKIDETKPWLLLVHGFPTSAWDWSGMWDALDARFNLAALDMLGFGLSDKPKNITYNLIHQSDLQEALLERLGVGNAHLLVHDYGVSVGQELLARHNEGSLSFTINSLCFLNGGIFPGVHRPLPIQKFGVSPLGFLLGYLMNKTRFKKNFSKIFGANTQPSEEELDAHWSLICEQGGNKIQHKLLRYMIDRTDNKDRWVGALMETRVPLRLINGGVDPVSGKHLYEHYVKTVPNADAVLYEKLGHYPQTEDPAAITSSFFDFHQKIGTQFS